MKRAEKAQKRFLSMFETADPKEFERRKKRWLRSEALADIEKGYGSETSQGLASGTSRSLETQGRD